MRMVGVVVVGFVLVLSGIVCVDEWDQIVVLQWIKALLMFVECKFDSNLVVDLCIGVVLGMMMVDICGVVLV